MSDTIRPISRFDRESTNVPHWIVQMDMIGPLQRFAVIVLLMYETIGEEPTQEDIAAIFGYKSTRNVQILMKPLVDAGIVKTRQRGGGRPSLYFIYKPDSPRSKRKKRRCHDQLIVDDQLIVATISRPNGSKGGVQDHLIAPPGLGGGGSPIGKDSKEAEPPPPRQQTAVERWLFGQGVGAAQEFADLDFAAVRDDFERRRAAGQPIGVIVKAWRASPPSANSIPPKPPTYTREWFDWVRRYDPQTAELYRLADDQADDLAADLDDWEEDDAA